MTSITIRDLSDETKARLKQQADARGRSLESYVRGLLDSAAEYHPKETEPCFPHDLIALVEPGDDIERFIEELDQKQTAIDL